MIFKRGESWGYRLLVRPPCGHEHEVLASWIDKDGRFNGILQCSTCRRKYEDVILEGWTP